MGAVLKFVPRSVTTDATAFNMNNSIFYPDNLEDLSLPPPAASTSSPRVQTEQPKSSASTKTNDLRSPPDVQITINNEKRKLAAKWNHCSMMAHMILFLTTCVVLVSSHVILSRRLRESSGNGLPFTLKNTNHTNDTEKVMVSVHNTFELPQNLSNAIITMIGCTHTKHGKSKRKNTTITVDAYKPVTEKPEELGATLSNNTSNHQYFEQPAVLVASGTLPPVVRDNRPIDDEDGDFTYDDEVPSNPDLLGVGIDFDRRPTNTSTVSSSNDTNVDENDTNDFIFISTTDSAADNTSDTTNASIVEVTTLKPEETTLIQKQNNSSDDGASAADSRAKELLLLSNTYAKSDNLPKGIDFNLRGSRSKRSANMDQRPAPMNLGSWNSFIFSEASRISNHEKKLRQKYVERLKRVESPKSVNIFL